MLLMRFSRKNLWMGTDIDICCCQLNKLLYSRWLKWDVLYTDAHIHINETHSTRLNACGPTVFGMMLLYKSKIEFCVKMLWLWTLDSFFLFDLLLLIFCGQFAHVMQHQAKFIADRKTMKDRVIFMMCRKCEWN